MKVLNIFICSVLIGFNCDGQQPNKEQSVINAKKFIQFINSLCTLTGNGKKLIMNNSKIFHIKESDSYKVDKDIQIMSYYAKPVWEISTRPLTGKEYSAMNGLTRMQCNFSCILDHNHVVFVEGYYAINSTLEGSDACDSFFLQKLGGHGYCNNCTHGRSPRCAFRFSSIDLKDATFLSGTAGEDSAYIKQDYTEVSTLYEILKSKPSFHEDVVNIPNYDPYTYAQDNLQSTPRIRNFYRLYNKGKYRELVRLMHSRNIIFNWFMSEALYAYNSRLSFLTVTEKAEVESFNGKSGYPMFRSPDFLNKLYPALIDTIFINDFSRVDTPLIIRRSQLNSVKIFVVNNTESTISINDFTTGGSDITLPNRMDIRPQERAPFFLNSLRAKDIFPTSTTIVIYTKTKFQEGSTHIKVEFYDD